MQIIPGRCIVCSKNELSINYSNSSCKYNIKVCKYIINIYRKVIAALVEATKFNTLTSMYHGIMVWVFMAQFFNTAILLLIVNANLKEIWHPLGSILAGIYPDFTSAWYREVGSLFAKAMCINIIQPITEFLIGVLKIYIYIYIVPETESIYLV